MAGASGFFHGGGGGGGRGKGEEGDSNAGREWKASSIDKSGFQTKDPKQIEAYRFETGCEQGTASCYST